MCAKACKYFATNLACSFLPSQPILLALVLSSAGPCFYDLITGTKGPYGELMAYLQVANQQFRNWSLEAQSYLWQGYLGGNVEAGGGISAMPSLHVAVEVLQALLGWQIGRKLGLLLTVYAAVVLLGSVHFGWHYAVDGYLSIALTAAVWFGSGRLLRSPKRKYGLVTGPNYPAF
ncbi:MAG: phosphatase PAP2 family protein [Kiloniellales bacterium]